eukprot:153971-Amphidinium_carterae.1
MLGSVVIPREANQKGWYPRLTNRRARKSKVRSHKQWRQHIWGSSTTVEPARWSILSVHLFQRYKSDANQRVLQEQAK